MFGLSFVIGGPRPGSSGGLVALHAIRPAARSASTWSSGPSRSWRWAGSATSPERCIGARVLSLAEGLISTFVPGGGSWGFGVAFLILLLVLMVRPSGLFGRQVQRHERSGSARSCLYVAIAAPLDVAWSRSDRPSWSRSRSGSLISAILALAWDILSRTGQVSLGHAAFFGIGGYGSGLLTPCSARCSAGPLGILICGVVGGRCSALVTLRLRRLYFTIATLSLQPVIQVLILVTPGIDRRLDRHHAARHRGRVAAAAAPRHHRAA